MRFAKSMVDLIGNTPLVQLNRVNASVEPVVLAKAGHHHGALPQEDGHHHLLLQKIVSTPMLTKHTNPKHPNLIPDP